MPCACSAPRAVVDDFSGPAGAPPNPQLWSYLLAAGGNNGELQAFTNSPRNASLDGNGNLAIVDKRLATRPFVLGARPTIADVSLVGYLYYPAEEFGFDIPATFPAIGKWLDRMKALPGWKHPYELMPGYPLNL